MDASIRCNKKAIYSSNDRICQKRTDQLMSSNDVFIRIHYTMLFEKDELVIKPISLHVKTPTVPKHHLLFMQQLKRQCSITMAIKSFANNTAPTFA